MTRYEVIQKIMCSNTLCESDKVYNIEMFLKDWYTEKDLAWIWEQS